MIEKMASSWNIFASIFFSRQPFERYQFLSNFNWAIAPITRWLIGVLLPHVIMATAQAAELVRIDVARDAGVFNISAEFLTDVQPESVLSGLSDYQNFKQLNPSIQESVVLKRLDSSNAEVRIVIRTCILIFCADLTQVQIFTIGDRELQATIIPDQSDFRSGRVHWRFKSEGVGTNVSLDAQLEPDFWIPPIIGLFLVKRYLSKQALTTLNAIERLHKV